MNCLGSRLPCGGVIMAAERSQFANSPVVSTNRFSYFDPFLQSIAAVGLSASRCAQSLSDNQVMSNCKQQCDDLTARLATHQHEPESAVAGLGR